ncbi:MAG TPA: cytochrome c oxidase assembly protein [Ktedonobacterales bacterium]|nr:cytochrome c oxidase assembly protein [Ktedonobacterales bacterium]
MTIWVYANGWPVPPTVLLGCVVAEVLYIRGWMSLVKADVASKASRAGSRAGRYRWDSWFWRGVYFVIALFLALVGDSAPVDILSGQLFWVHMIQHLLLLVVIAPLLVAAAPLQPLWLGFPGWMRRLARAAATPNIRRVVAGVEHWLRHPMISCALLLAGIWVWHWPTLYDLALTNDTIHDWCEHLTFLLVSLIFWTQIISSPPFVPRANSLGQMMCVGFAIIQNVVLAALLGFAQVPLYAPYVHLATAPVILAALHDQQLGAGIMWTFGDVPFGLALSILFQRWLAEHSDDASIALQTPRATEG